MGEKIICSLGTNSDQTVVDKDDNDNGDDNDAGNDDNEDGNNDVNDDDDDNNNVVHQNDHQDSLDRLVLHEKDTEREGGGEGWKSGLREREKERES